MVDLISPQTVKSLDLSDSSVTTLDAGFTLSAGSLTITNNAILDVGRGERRNLQCRILQHDSFLYPQRPATTA